LSAPSQEVCSAEHSINLSHLTQPQNTIILVKKVRQIDQILGEVIEIELHFDDMNKDDSFFLSQAWKPVTYDLKQQRQSHTKELTPFNGP
jgi:hypothetical protein